MTFSDILTVLGAGAGTLVLFTVAAAPLLADLGPGRRRREAPAAAPATHVVGVPAPRSPLRADGMARAIVGEHEAATARHATAG